MEMALSLEYLHCSPGHATLHEIELAANSNDHGETSDPL